MEDGLPSTPWMQDSVRGYNQTTLNNYMATVILCGLYNQTCNADADLLKNLKNMKQKQLFRLWRFFCT